MAVSDRKTKNVSVRLSPEELRTLQVVCNAQGSRSVSDLVRTAVQSLAASGGKTEALADEVKDLRRQLRLMLAELDRLSEIAQSHDAKAKGQATS